MLIPFVVCGQSFGFTVEWSFSLICALLFTSSVCIGGGFLLFYKGLPFLPVGLATVLELTIPVIGILLGYLFLDESFSMTQLGSLPLFLFFTYRLSTKTN